MIAPPKLLITTNQIGSLMSWHRVYLDEFICTQVSRQMVFLNNDRILEVLSVAIEQSVSLRSEYPVCYR